MILREKVQTIEKIGTLIAIAGCIIAIFDPSATKINPPTSIIGGDADDNNNMGTTNTTSAADSNTTTGDVTESSGGVFGD